MDKEKIPTPGDDTDWFEQFLTGLAKYIDDEIDSHVDGDIDFYLILCNQGVQGHSCIISNTMTENILKKVADEIKIMQEGQKFASNSKMH